MRKYLILIIYLITMLTVISYADSAKLNLSKYGLWDWNKSPNILILNNKDILVVWVTGPVEKEADIVYRYYDVKKNNWIPDLNSPPRVAIRRNYTCFFPKMVQDSKGGIHIIYDDGVASSHRDIYYKYFPEITDNKVLNEDQSSRKRFKDSTNSAWARIAIDKETDDLYVGWYHPHSGTTYTKSDIVYFKKPYGKDWLTQRRGLSKSPNERSMHPALVFTHGNLHGVWMQGPDEDKYIAANYANSDGNGPTQIVPVPLGRNGYYPELEADSQGNVMALFTYKLYSAILYAYKPHNGAWKEGAILGRGCSSGMFGLCFADNDVAYVTSRIPYTHGYYVTLTRMRYQNISPTQTVTDDTHFTGGIKVQVDENGAAHLVWWGAASSHAEKTGILYKRIDQAGGGPKVRVNFDQDLIITGDQVTFQGEVLSKSSPIATHRWKIRDHLPYNVAGQNLTTTFTKAGIYEVCYFVADSKNLLGHDSYTVEVLDTPYPPINTISKTDLLKGFLFRGYTNSMSWKNDPKNDEKFPNIMYSTIYRKRQEDTEWNSIFEIPFIDSATTYTYTDKDFLFKTESEANVYDYAVTVTADVGGVAKESKMAIFTRSQTASNIEKAIQKKQETNHSAKDVLK